ncbi:MAG: hypothetical protein UH249_05875 [Acutalibacteraceae bacterium]|nr:hypothetical protein [Acutalibacteraceae bacterium]
MGLMFDEMLTEYTNAVLKEEMTEKAMIMVKDGLVDEKIIKYTGLSESELQKLKRRNENGKQF